MSQPVHLVAQHHVLPLRTYLAVFSALLVLTGITVGVSFLDLGRAAIYAALLVAVIKAGLVVGYFMHLKFDDRFHSLIFFGSLIFLVLFFILTFIDLANRGRLVEEHNDFALRRDQQIEEETTGKVTIGQPTKQSGTRPRVLPQTPKQAAASPGGSAGDGGGPKAPTAAGEASAGPSPAKSATTQPSQSEGAPRPQPNRPPANL